MYQTGEIVSYGINGVCRITALTERTVGSEKTLYYQLEPVRGNNATVLVPTNSETLLRKMRPVLSAGEINALLQSLPGAPDQWTDNEQDRKLRYREIFGGSDAFALASLACSLYRQKQALTARGRRLRQVDEAAWKDAERLLSDEFSYVLGSEPGEIVQRLRACA